MQAGHGVPVEPLPRPISIVQPEVEKSKNSTINFFEIECHDASAESVAALPIAVASRRGGSSDGAGAARPRNVIGIEMRRQAPRRRNTLSELEPAAHAVALL